MKYNGIIRKSRTYDFAALIAILSAVQPFIPQLELAQNTTTMIGMSVAGAVACLRKTTTGSVGDK